MNLNTVEVTNLWTSRGRSLLNNPAAIKLCRIMKLTTILLLAGCLTAGAGSVAQTVTLSEKEAPLEKVLRSIKVQTGYNFLYTESVLTEAKKVTIEVRNMQLADALKICFSGQPFTYQIIDKTIVINEAGNTNTTTTVTPVEPPPPPLINVKGKVVNENGEPVAASVMIKGTKSGTSTNTDGEFFLRGVDDSATLVISGITIAKAVEVKVNAKTDVGAITVSTKEQTLNEVVVKRGYWDEKKETMLGNVSRISEKEIKNQPVVNVLQALQGRAPGLEIVQVSGIPGAAIKINIRGENSISRMGSDGSENAPLYVIDGVPVASTAYNSWTTFNSDPLNTINPENIESIEILKDADATAIYGSRGANGVVLITTKKGLKNPNGKTIVEGSTSFGITKVPRVKGLLAREQYLAMRRQAFANDGIIPTANPSDNGSNGKMYAPDLMVWDTTRSTDWQKELIGKATYINDGQLTLFGGNAFTNFRLNGGYHRETMPFPGDFGYQRASGSLNVQHKGHNNKFNANVTVNYGADNNKLFDDQDLNFAAINLVPVAPALYKPDGSLNWEIRNGSSTWANPLAKTLINHVTKTNNLIANTTLGYEVIEDLKIKLNLGFTQVDNDQVIKTPLTSFNPNNLAVAQNSTVRIEYAQRAWIAEPQLTYFKKAGEGQLTILIGSTWQVSKSNDLRIRGLGYASDNLLGDIIGASQVYNESTGAQQYRYQAVFGRLAYNWKTKYLINLTGRRDGSSRFGPGKQYGNFGAVGLGWIFTKEKFFEENLGFISFGKLRSSYGITGSDNIGDYKFLSTYSATTTPYQVPGLIPTSLFNADLAWENTHKLEAALELGFLNDQYNVSISWYRNRSSNQLVGFPLPAITGFSTAPGNLPATVQNTGLEFTLSLNNTLAGNVGWKASANFTIPKNKLISFPGIEGTVYANRYTVGQPLNTQNDLYTGIGVNAQTGLYEVADVNGDGLFNTLDRNKLIFGGRRFYGGLSNSFSYKGFELDFLLEFVSQNGAVGRFRIFQWTPGTFQNLRGYGNQLSSVVNQSWVKPGDNTEIQRITQTISANQHLSRFSTSHLGYDDASFIRLKTISLSYTLPRAILKRVKLEYCNFFVRGQNIFTLTRYDGFDPQSPGRSEMPALKAFTAGVQFKFI